MPDGPGTGFGSGAEVGADSLGDLRVRLDGPESVGQSGRGLPDPRSPGGQLGHAGGEHDQRGPSRQGGRGGTDGVEAGAYSRLGYCLGAVIVVADKLGWGQAQLGADGLVGQVQHRQALGSHLADTTPDLEGVDASVEEVAEQLCPCCLFLVGGVPRSWATATVVAAVGDGGLSEGKQREPGRALVPKGPAQLLSGEPADDLVDDLAQT